MSKAEQKGAAAPARGRTVNGDAAPLADPAQPVTVTAADRTTPVDIQAYIGTRLREVYNDVANQPVPDRFLDLMRQLDQK